MPARPHPASRRVVAAALIAIAAAIAPARSDAKPFVHVIESGQTLAGIAQRYGVTVASICMANRIRAAQTIHPGQKLVVPGIRVAPEGPPAQPEPAPMPLTTAREVKLAARNENRGYVILRGRLHDWRGYAVLPDGTVPPVARQGFAQVLASWRTGRTRGIDPRLIRLLARVADHFAGRTIVVTSGFRPWSKEQYALRSKHNFGQAVDFFIPGVPNEVVRDFCRSLPGAGVGYYPNSSFVHLDTRGRSTYWVDLSGPGQPPRYATPTGKEPATVHRKPTATRVAPRGRKTERTM
jgi:LysM repeat protein